MYVEDKILRDWLRLMNDAGIENLTSEEHEFLDRHAKYVQGCQIGGEEPNARWVRESRDHWVCHYLNQRHRNPFFRTA
jgi:hypothetical protein